MNNKGFAASTIIYMLIIVFSILIFSSVVLNTNANKIEGKVVEEAKNLLNVYNENDLTSIKTKVYRYVTADGTWSSWTEYTSKADINHTVVLTNLTNTGGLGNAFDLDPTDLNLVIENGVSYLDFNGTTSKADGQNTTANEIKAQTIYAKFKKTTGINATTSSEKIYALDNDTGYTLVLGSTGAALCNETLTLKQSASVMLGTAQPFEGDTKIIVIYVWDPNLNSYQMFINGKKNPNRITADTYAVNSFKEIDLGYNSIDTHYANVDLYDLVLSSQTISQGDALEVSAGNIDITNAIPAGNLEVRYGDYIQYGEYIEDDSEIVAVDREESPTFNARYVKDYVNGSTLSTGDHWVEVEVNAYFNEGDTVAGVKVGGTYTGSINMNKNANGSANYGEFQVISGTFSPPEGAQSTIGINERILSSFESSTGERTRSGFLMFIGTHPGDFNDWNGAPLNTTGESDFFIVTKNIGNTWYYDDNSTWIEFAPSSDDYIVGYAEENIPSLGITHSSSFVYPFSYNVALERPVSGYDGTNPISLTNGSRVNDGDLTASSYTSNAGTVYPQISIDLGYDYPIKDVTVWHYYPGSRTYYQTKTILESSGGTTKTLRDYSVDGTYLEQVSGLTSPVIE